MAFYDVNTEMLTTLRPSANKTRTIKVDGYGRMKDAKKPEIMIKAKSPIDLVVTAPDGEIITKEIGQSPTMEYQVYNLGEDGNLDDMVIGGETKIGNYLIQVVSEPDALPTDTYSLEIIADGITIILAENIQVSDIPDQPYIVRSTEEKIESVISATVDIDPNTLNIKSVGKWITCYIELPAEYNVEEIDIVRLWVANTQIASKGTPTEINDYDEDGIPDLMVKFNRGELVKILKEKNLTADDVTLVVDGQVGNEWFAGTDIIKIIGATEENESIDEGMAPMKPTEFALLQNYSNPFNPDTWIPYHLAEDVDVTIRIYDISGKLIRTLSLGQKPTGFYTTKDKAAYWDGKNEAGERVSSGIYFYTIQAGDFTAIRKMVITE